MEEIDILELLKLFWTKKISIIIIVGIFTVIGIIYTIYFVKPVYTSSTKLVLATLNNTKNAESAINTNDITLNSKLVSTYSELIKSNKIIRQVKENINIDTDEDILKKNVHVNSVKDTELIEIKVTNANRYLAKEIANEIANVFIDAVKEYYKIDNIHVVDVAEVEENPSNINHKKDVVLFIGVGIVTSIMYVFVYNLFDTTVKTAEEIENMYQIPVIAAIPTNEENLSKDQRRRKN